MFLSSAATCLLASLLLASVLPSGKGLKCLNAEGEYVDWYTVYKLPKLHEGDWKIREGVAFLSMNTTSTQWTLSDQAMNETRHEVYNTLQQIYTAEANSLMYFMYNDERPKSTAHNGGGHTKGVVAFDKTSGFWLVHSTPRFPPHKTDGYSWPSNAHEYGQNFLCISFGYKVLGDIGTQLQYNEPHVYDYSVPSDFASDFPVLNDVIKGIKPKSRPWYSIKQLPSLGDIKFVSLAKAGAFEADLYEDLVAPVLKTSLLVETWQLGSGGVLPSNCSRKACKVFNVKDISLPYNISFKESQDHSKWAVSYTKDSVPSPSNGIKTMNITPTSQWTCIGDINRMESQFKRGGGTVCFQNAGVWQAYRTSVSKYMPC